MDKLNSTLFQRTFKNTISIQVFTHTLWNLLFDLMKFKLIRCLATHFSFVEKKKFVLINPKAYTQRDNLALCKWKDDGWTPIDFRLISISKIILAPINSPHNNKDTADLVLSWGRL